MWRKIPAWAQMCKICASTLGGRTIGSEAEEDQPEYESGGEASVMQISHCATVGEIGKKTIRL